MDLELLFKDIEDHLFPSLRLTIRQRALYYHLLRHTRLVGAEKSVFALVPLANDLNVAESTVRDDLREMHTKGCLRIEERSRLGHHLLLLLPREIDGIVVDPKPDEVADIEMVDFYTDRRYLEALFRREEGRCFYCLRNVQKETCQLDHVVPKVTATNNSFRNIVVTCHECNALKQGNLGGDFVRSLYRRGALSLSELEERLSAIDKLQSGQLVPSI